MLRAVRSRAIAVAALTCIASPLPAARATSQDQITISNGDPAGWDEWNSGNLVTRQTDPRGRAKSLKVNFATNASHKLQYLTIDDGEQWRLNLTDQIKALPFPAPNRIKVLATLDEHRLFEEIVLRLPYYIDPPETADRKCAIVEIAILRGSVYDRTTFTADQQSCET